MDAALPPSSGGVIAVYDSDSAAAVDSALSNAVKNWTGKPLAGQVKDTWEEIVQKKPHGDIAQ